MSVKVVAQTMAHRLTCEPGFKGVDPDSLWDPKGLILCSTGGTPA